MKLSSVQILLCHVFWFEVYLSLVSYPIRCSFLTLIFLRGPYVHILLSALGLILAFLMASVWFV